MAGFLNSWQSSNKNGDNWNDGNGNSNNNSKNNNNNNNNNNKNKNKNKNKNNHRLRGGGGGKSNRLNRLKLRHVEEDCHGDGLKVNENENDNGGSMSLGIGNFGELPSRGDSFAANLEGINNDKNNGSSSKKGKSIKLKRHDTNSSDISLDSLYYFRRSKKSNLDSYVNVNFECISYSYSNWQHNC